MASIDHPRSCSEACSGNLQHSSLQKIHLRSPVYRLDGRGGPARDFGLGLIFQSVLPCPTAFKTKSNFEIADRAFQKGYRQKSWKDALGVALELDGRSDEADWPFAEKLRGERAKLTAQFGLDRKETMIGPIVTVRLN